MAAGRTYTPIATQTTTSSVASVTFNSIPSTYTDLVLVISTGNVAVGPTNTTMTLNGDNGSNYSVTVLNGNGTSAASGRYPNNTNILLDYYGVGNNSFGNHIIVNIQNYSNTTTYKTLLTRSGRAATETSAIVALWRSTAAINALNIASGVNFAPGSTFTLYGIAAA